MKEYNHKVVEQKWQDYWRENQSFKIDENTSKEKFYTLVEFPYPSGDGLHVGHARPYTAMDVISRMKRLQGYEVLFPMGWDAFGLPTENYAIKHKIHPRLVTQTNVSNFKNQLESLGFSFDWSKEINTTDPKYYKWTQWIFLQLFKKDLAYKTQMPINWCPDCKVGLANEEVVQGKCERCGEEVEQRTRSQWMLKITEYADRLIDDLDLVDYPERVKAQQINWIGRSQGASIKFKVANTEDYLEIYTTRPDTIFGSTYMVIAPEHNLIDKYSHMIENMEDLEEYRHKVLHMSEFERTQLVGKKTGIQIKGLKAINPFNNREIPIWISDYVLATYGTGAIMGVPGHDQRDYDFAKAFGLEIIPVYTGGDIENEVHLDTQGESVINSDFLNGMGQDQAIEEAIKYAENNNIGEAKTNYRLRDWVFSRQRYWGEPIPIVKCDKCGYVPVAEEDLPVELPDVENYETTDDGQSPLANIEEWVNTTCPKCGQDAKRETDTMPQWAGSSWYFLRYIDPDNDINLADPDLIDKWMPVDWYNGGMEHTTLHLLYSRFWNKFLYDIGLVPYKEPYQKRTSHGMILGPDGSKMSKSLGNVINPNQVVEEEGADTLRTYEMFMGDFQQSAAWSTESLIGCRRFLERVWNLQNFVVDGDEYSPELEVLIHQTIKKVTEDYPNLKFNTAIAQLMTLQNEMNQLKKITRKDLETFLILLNPVAPHITEEIWQILEYPATITESSWPTYEEDKTIEDSIEYPVQINGKVKMTISVPRDTDKEGLKELVLQTDQGRDLLEGKEIIKEIFVPEKIYNIVIK